MAGRRGWIETAAWAADIEPEALERAQRGTIERAYPAGSYVCHRGDRFDFWTGVVAGLVKISTISRSGKAMTFAGIPSGGWFGEGSLLKDEARKYDLVAIRETRMALMNRATFLWLTENSVGFNRYLVRQLNERMGQFIATIEYDRMLGAKARVARNISWLFNPVLYPGTGEDIEISQEELALLAGVSRPVVNKSLRELEAEGLVKVEHGRIAALDLSTLGRYDR